MLIDAPKSAADVLTVIEKIERSKKLVWTAGRVLEKACQTRFSGLPFEQQKVALRHTTELLETLEAQGILERRSVRQGTLYGQEIGFDFVRTAKKHRGGESRDS
ncbi:MAG TPA: hypothetical protein VHY48_05710 [Acidobacteriaceae bacterium]|jgi:hypothetical protein|nr:hypothetical protein [Acidobacteriaceae bacterium]